MFTELQKLLNASTTLLLSASLAEPDESGPRIRLTITPHTTDKTPAVLNSPLVVTATAEELDHDLAGQLTQYIGLRQSSGTSLAALEMQIE